MEQLKELLKTELDSYKLIYALTLEQNNFIKKNDLSGLWVSIREKARLIDTIKEVELLINPLRDQWINQAIDQSTPQPNFEIKTILSEIFSILEKNIAVEKENGERIRQLKEDINKGLIDLNNVDKGIKKYLSGKKPRAKFLDKKQ